MTLYCIDSFIRCLLIQTQGGSRILFELPDANSATDQADKQRWPVTMPIIATSRFYFTFFLCLLVILNGSTSAGSRSALVLAFKNI